MPAPKGGVLNGPDIPLAPLLEALAAELAPCRDPWWLIGSAAMWLHGAAEIEVRDIDLLLSRRDAGAALARRGLPAVAGPPHPLFRSDCFGRWEEPPYTVELFAGFSVRRPGAWMEMIPATREAKRVGHATLWIPSVAELIAWGRLYGRDKDARREPLLRALLPRPGG